MSGFLPPIERLTFLDGQTLSAADFNEAWKDDEQFHALHNRYLHRTWGISTGLDAAIASNHLAAIVQPGYAIDALGRDIVILNETTVPAPVLPLAQVLLLTADSGGTCEWWSPYALKPGEQVPLLAAYVANGKIVGSPDFSRRRYVHSMAVPRVATGATESGHTGWTDGPAPTAWIEATIDTTDGGFVNSPQYFAWLDPPNGQLFIESTAAQSFVVRVLPGAANAAQAESDGWAVHWIGIETGGAL